ncbi:hypothetical protein [Palaeococcus ferrophilus]|uniref:hypothetical protein n=1 Tax=Palaeococcus ferrophilus TaxID=83868 RepID=UPI001476A3B8|nr:hypothetical protein [Palaeococcus ferrophilus]
MVALTKEGVEIICRDTGGVVATFTWNDIADILQFRYATPWNRLKEVLEELSLTMGELDELYAHARSQGREVSKELIEDYLKKRKTF